jgi:proline-specific peptidase
MLELEIDTKIWLKWGWFKVAQYTKQGTYYSAVGNGEALIFIHGVGNNHTMWKPHMEYFSSDYKVYAYDMLGHGRSVKPSKELYTLEDFTSQLNTFMDELNIESAIIVGFSMGGMIAQAFAISFPERVRKLVIANAVANRNEEERKAVLNRVKLVEKEGRISVVDRAINRWFNQDYIKNNPEVVLVIKDRVRHDDDKVYLKSYRLFATADKELWNELDKINAPTLIITGENDIGSNPRMAKQMNEKITNSKVIIVPNVKHMLPIEMQNIFNKHLKEFFQQCEKEVNYYESVEDV